MMPRPVRAGRLLRGALVALGWVVLVAAADLAAGALVGLVVDPRGDELVVGSAAAVQTVTAEEQVQVDVRSATPAMRDLPWAEDYWEEYFRVDYAYDPFLVGRAERAEGRYINVDRGVRRSYEPAATDTAPVVWFFGGSTMWGEGQRDEHTIPSEVTRLAEAAGAPITAVNFGSPGYTSWEAMLRFEQELAHRPAPDLAVFYDGTNDLRYQNIQLEAERGDPAPEHPAPHHVLSSGSPTPVPDEVEVEVRQPASGWERWERTSLVGRWLFAPAGAATDDPGPLVDEAEAQALQDRVIEVYGRAARLVRGLALDHDVPVVQTWQPISSGPVPGLYEGIPGRLPGVVDLSGSLEQVEDDAVYIDGGHTNELGARLVAEAMWPAVEQALGG